ncbi:hypothetical protein A6X20_01260 [Bradyrhizobium elkanii]|nr:hypothetical protein A6452_16550 [Bradyrhizobium elkanii]ODM86297.1 hypothetical protein A6X20_01260 [Bradyrhizobium elkanii]
MQWVAPRVKSFRSEAATDTGMDTVGVIMAVAAITMVGDAAIIMAGTGAITTVGAIITATGGDCLNQRERSQSPRPLFID